jgi:hypothetical protein
MSTLIGALGEKSLHAALKNWYRQPGDRVEEHVDNYVIDIVRGRQLIEIQSRNFAMIRNKLKALCERGPAHLVYPIAKIKWIVRIDKDGNKVSKRKSPKRGRKIDLFDEMIYIPKIAQHSNFSFETILIEVEEIWRDDGLGSWRKKGWSISDRRLIEVLSHSQFLNISDYAALIPEALPEVFTNAMLAKSLQVRPRLAGKMSYCLHKMGALDKVGKEGRAILYSRTT